MDKTLSLYGGSQITPLAHLTPPDDGNPLHQLSDWNHWFLWEIAIIRNGTKWTKIFMEISPEVDHPVICWSGSMSLGHSRTTASDLGLSYLFVRGPFSQSAKDEVFLNHADSRGSTP
jgi:hypothetical protein